MKYLITGLGNPGAKYDHTRHNIGFDVVDAIAKQCDTFFTEDRHGLVTLARHKGRVLILLKPTTFMNLSGKAVNYWLQKEKIPLSNLMVVTDDIALPFGKLRMKPKGSDGGHNGLKDIQATLGRQDYPRLRFGVGNDFPKGRQSDYVLGEWTPEQMMELPARIDKAKQGILDFTTVGISLAMNSTNNG